MEEVSDFEEVNSSIVLPELLSWNSRSVYDFVEHIVDYEDFDELSNAINHARLGLFKISKKLNEFDQKLVLAKTEYDREYRRRYLSTNAKTETQRKARAELMCENLENEVIKYTQIRTELARQAGLLRTELDMLGTVSNNFRQQMKL